MKNIYSVFDLDVKASLLDICLNYQKKCMEKPGYIFYYTNLLDILTNYPKKLVYDAMLLQTDLFILDQAYQIYYFLDEEQEYDLAIIISWMEDFRDFVYDAKFFFTNPLYLNYLEAWYNQMESILMHLKSLVKTFHLA